MSSVRQLRADAAASLRKAKKSCTAATKDAKLVASTRCEMLKAAELRIAQKHCEAAHRSVELARAAYQRARPVVTEARVLSRAKSSEKRERDRSDAVDKVMQRHAVPEGVADIAVRIVERKGVARTGPAKMRWARLAEAVTGSELSDAWVRYEKKTGRARPWPPKEAAAKKAAKKAPPKKAPPKKRAPRRAARAVEAVEVFYEFGEGDFEVF